MSEKKTLTFAIMDAPFENARTATALRLMDIAARRGYHIYVFAYEGAVGLTFSRQAPHGNEEHGHSVEIENHPLPMEWVEAIMQTAKENGGQLDWINCGLCADERGVTESIDGVRRGKPLDLWECSNNSDGTLVIGTR